MKILGTTVPQPLERAAAACKRHFALAAGFSALVNILYLAPTLYMMQVYDRVVPTSGIQTLIWLTVIVAIALASLAALDGARSRVMMRASLRLNRLLAGEIFNRLMSRRQVKRDTTSTSQAMREFDVLRQALGGQAAIALFDLPWTPLYFVVAFMIHPALGGMIVLGAAILVFLALRNERANKPLSDRAHAANAAAYLRQETMVGKSEVIRILGMRGSLVVRQIKEREQGLEAASEVQFAGNRYNSLVKFIRMFMQSLALGAGAWLAIEGRISVGAIIAASVLLNRALQPIEQIAGHWPALVQARQAMAALARLFESTDDPQAQRTALPEPEGRLELDRITVRSPAGDAFLLKNVCLKLTPGEVLGVIGPSGAGKSQLARVAAGGLPPDAGEVRIDDAKITDWDFDALARHIGYLPQDSALLPGTIGENISRFAEDRCEPRDIIDAEVIRSAQQAGIHEMVLRLPKGYDTPLGEGQHQLSAGQAQRVALARALYGSPKILILDEPNAWLDAEGEAALLRAVAASRLKRTAIMIVAHRASILADADTLLVLQDGAVTETGPRAEILESMRERAARMNVVPMADRRQP